MLCPMRLHGVLRLGAFHQKRNELDMFSHFLNRRYIICSAIGHHQAVQRITYIDYRVKIHVCVHYICQPYRCVFMVGLHYVHRLYTYTCYSQLGVPWEKNTLRKNQDTVIRTQNNYTADDNDNSGRLGSCRWSPIPVHPRVCGDTLQRMRRNSDWHWQISQFIRK